MNKDKPTDADFRDGAWLCDRHNRLVPAVPDDDPISLQFITTRAGTTLSWCRRYVGEGVQRYLSKESSEMLCERNRAAAFWSVQRGIPYPDLVAPEEHPCSIRCWRVGGSVDVPKGSPCPECGRPWKRLKESFWLVIDPEYPALRLPSCVRAYTEAHAIQKFSRGDLSRSPRATKLTAAQVKELGIVDTDSVD